MEQPKLINNITERVVDDLRQRLSAHSRISIAAVSLSIYAYEALRQYKKRIAALKKRFANESLTKDLNYINNCKKLKDKTTA